MVVRPSGINADEEGVGMNRVSAGNLVEADVSRSHGQLRRIMGKEHRAPIQQASMTKYRHTSGLQGGGEVALGPHVVLRRGSSPNTEGHHQLYTKRMEGRFARRIRAGLVDL